MKHAIPRLLQLKNKASNDLLVIALLAILLFAVSVWFDISDLILRWIFQHDTWEFHELFTVAPFLIVAFAVYAWRRNRELTEQIRRREKAEAEKAILVPELENALADVSRLKKLLPTCSRCRKIRDSSGYWLHIDQYLEVYLQTRLDGGLCPDCAREIYGNGKSPAGRVRT